MPPPCSLIVSGSLQQFRYPAAAQSPDVLSDRPPPPRGAGLLAPAGSHVPPGLASSWAAPLCLLRDRAVVTRGSASELTAYRDFVADCLSRALAASCSPTWRDSGLPGALTRALALCAAGKASAARQAGVELIGFARLAQALQMQSAGAVVDSNAIHAAGDAAMQAPPSSGRGGRGGGNTPAAARAAGEFKVPAARGSPEQPQQQQQQERGKVEQPPQVTLPPAAAAAGPRRHSAPKRRATPQVLAAAPPLLSTPAASGPHGAACCDEQLLSTWCPISGKRQKLSPPPRGGSSSSGNSSGSDDDDSQGSQTCTALDAGLTLPFEQQQQLSPSLPAPLLSDGSSSSVLRQPASAAVPVQQQQQPDAVPPPRPPLPPKPLSAAAGERGGGSSSSTTTPTSSSSSKSAAAAAAAVARVTRLMHQDPASVPAPHALLFNAEGAQLPVDTWTGAVKHTAGGRAVELCSIALQLPAPYLEELPSALSAADVRHRRSVSLGRHVVCRATLGPLTEHQLSSLAAMAGAQLVAVCRLQTAELHLVPYFDNRNLVRAVGFLKPLQQ